MHPSPPRVSGCPRTGERTHAAPHPPGDGEGTISPGPAVKHTTSDHARKSSIETGTRAQHARGSRACRFSSEAASELPAQGKRSDGGQVKRRAQARWRGIGLGLWAHVEAAKPVFVELRHAAAEAGIETLDHTAYAPIVGGWTLHQLGQQPSRTHFRSAAPGGPEHGQHDGLY